jgi:prepilin-type N-terminal cleavage/methylation domain-containing protein
MLGKLKDSKGFTLIELFIVFVILGVLAEMAWTFMIDLRSRSFDVSAVADGKNLITLVRNNSVNLDDVDYTKINGSDVGVETTGGVARPPVFSLSPGVRIVVTAGSECNGCTMKTAPMTLGRQPVAVKENSITWLMKRPIRHYTA